MSLEFTPDDSQSQLLESINILPGTATIRRERSASGAGTGTRARRKQSSAEIPAPDAGALMQEIGQLGQETTVADLVRAKGQNRKLRVIKGGQLAEWISRMLHEQLAGREDLFSDAEKEALLQQTQDELGRRIRREQELASERDTARQVMEGLIERMATSQASQGERERLIEEMRRQVEGYAEQVEQQQHDQDVLQGQLREHVALLSSTINEKERLRETVRQQMMRSAALIQQAVQLDDVCYQGRHQAADPLTEDADAEALLYHDFTVGEHVLGSLAQDMERMRSLLPEQQTSGITAGGALAALAAGIADLQAAGGRAEGTEEALSEVTTALTGLQEALAGLHHRLELAPADPTAFAALPATVDDPAEQGAVIVATVHALAAELVRGQEQAQVQTETRTRLETELHEREATLTATTEALADATEALAGMQVAAAELQRHLGITAEQPTAFVALPTRSGNPVAQGAAMASAVRALSVELVRGQEQVQLQEEEQARHQSEWQNRLQDLEQQLAQERAAHATAVAASERALDEARGQLHQKSSLIVAQTAERQHWQDEATRLQARCVQMAQEHAATAAALTQEQGARTALQAEYVALGAQLAELVEQHAAQTRRGDRLAAELEDQRGRFGELERIRIAHDAEQARSQQQAQIRERELTEALALVRTESVRLAETLAVRTGELAALQAQSDDLAGRVASQEQELTAERRGTADLRAALAQVTTERAEAAQRLGELDRHAQALTGTVAQSQMELEHVRLARDVEKTEAAAAQARYEAQLAEVRLALARGRAEETAAREQLQAAAKLIAELEATRTGLATALAASETQGTALTQSLAQERTTVAELTAQLTTTRQRVEELSSAHAQLLQSFAVAPVAVSGAEPGGSPAPRVEASPSVVESPMPAAGAVSSGAVASTLPSVGEASSASTTGDLADDAESIPAPEQAAEAERVAAQALVVARASGDVQRATQAGERYLATTRERVSALSHALDQQRRAAADLARARDAAQERGDALQREIERRDARIAEQEIVRTGLSTALAASETQGAALTQSLAQERTTVAELTTRLATTRQRVEELETGLGEAEAARARTLAELARIGSERDGLAQALGEAREADAVSARERTRLQGELERLEMALGGRQVEAEALAQERDAVRAALAELQARAKEEQAAAEAERAALCRQLAAGQEALGQEQAQRTRAETRLATRLQENGLVRQRLRDELAALQQRVIGLLAEAETEGG